MAANHPVTDDVSDNTEAIHSWEVPVLHLFVGGIGLGLVLICAIGAFYFYRSRPKSWDRNAIRVIEPTSAAVDLSVGLEANTIAGRAGHGSTSSDNEESQNTKTGRAGIVVVDLRNTTGEDITLPISVLVMESEGGSHVLHNSKFALDRDYFIPAGHTVSVTLLGNDPCAPENSPEMCVESYFHGVDEIVLFAKQGRYEVHIPLKSIRLMRVEPK